jgi:hypothetical protein
MRLNIRAPIPLQKTRTFILQHVTTEKSYVPGLLFSKNRVAQEIR